jgi:hypothetical protein
MPACRGGTDATDRTDDLAQEPDPPGCARAPNPALCGSLFTKRRKTWSEALPLTKEQRWSVLWHVGELNCLGAEPCRPAAQSISASYGMNATIA